MNLRLTDFPSGWRAEAPTEDEGCAGIQKLSDRYGDDLLSHEDSQDFSQGENTTASSGAGLFADEATSSDALDYLEGSIQSDEFRKCLSDGVRQNAGSGVTVGDITVGQVSFPTFGDRSSAWEVVIPFEYHGLSVTAYIDAVYMRQANALADVVFTDTLSSFDEQERERLTGIVAERMNRAVGGSSPTTTAEESESEEGVAGVGDTLTLQGYEDGEQLDVTVTKVIDPAKAEKYFGPRRGRRFVAIDLVLENSGTVPYNDSPGNGATLIDAQDHGYEETLDESPSCHPLGSGVRIAPASKRAGCLVFEIPKSASPAVFQFALNSGFSEDTGEWQLR
jgi:hypothetical protein